MRFDDLKPGDLLVWGEGGPFPWEWFLYTHTKPYMNRLWLYGWNLKTGTMDMIMSGESHSEVVVPVFRCGERL